MLTAAILFGDCPPAAAQQHEGIDDLPVLLLGFVRGGDTIDKFAGRAVEFVWQVDENHDGLDAQEVRTAVAAEQAAPSAKGSPLGRVGDLPQLLAADPNHDGVLTTYELLTLAEQVFARVDSDHDGSISYAEQQAVFDRLDVLAKAQAMASCLLPPPPPGALIVDYSSGSGEAYSSLALGGQDQETFALDIAIEPGERPLYLMLASGPAIWRVNGATNRIVQVVATSGTFVTLEPQIPGGPRRKAAVAGVVGVPADRVTIEDAGCPSNVSNAKSRAGQAGLLYLQRTFGRGPDVTIYDPNGSRNSLPSGTAAVKPRADTDPPAGYDARIWGAALAERPRGLVRFDPHEVTAAAGVEPYVLLPRFMGLARLVGEHRVTVLGHGQYRVVRPIERWPAGLVGSTIHLAKGVPVPPGAAKSTCIIADETGEVLPSETVFCPVPRQTPAKQAAPPASAPPPQTVLE